MLCRLALVGMLVVAMMITPVAVTARDGTNEAPLAEAGLDQQVKLGATVLLDATGSRDPDGEIRSYAWRIETPDGTTIVPQCPTCGQSRFRPTMAGTYAVTVTIRDHNGGESTDTLYVTVENQSSSNHGNGQAPPTFSQSSPGVSNPVGIDPGSAVASCSDSSCQQSGTEPWVEINGPSSIATGQQAGLILEYGGFREDPQFGWSVGEDGVTQIVEWNSPGNRTIYVTAASDSQVARSNHDIRVTENQKPGATIQTPDDLHPGQQITLSVDASDSDGWVSKVRWVEGPEIIVPRGLNQARASVVVTDNDGAQAREVLVFTGKEIRRLESSPDALHTVYCYYNQESERKRQNPDHCEVENSDNSDDRDGYQSTTSNLYQMLESPHFNIIWKKVDEEIDQHSGDLANDVGTKHPDVIDNDGTTLTAPTLTEDQKDAITGDAATTSTQSFTLEGKTVSNDLNGDGEIDAGDWDERFGSDDSSPADTHSDAVSEAKDARRATNRATGGGGPAVDDDEHSDAPSTDSSGSPTDDSGSSDSDPLGGALPDSLPDISLGEHAADKGAQIADEGLDMGAGF